MDGAKGILINIAGSSDLGLFEINQAATIIAKSAHPDANIIWGTSIEDQLGDEVQVTVIASGFERRDASAAPAPQPSYIPPEEDLGMDDDLETPDRSVSHIFDADAEAEDEDLDIPSFLRKPNK